MLKARIKPQQRSVKQNSKPRRGQAPLPNLFCSTVRYFLTCFEENQNKTKNKSGRGACPRSSQFKNLARSEEVRPRITLFLQKLRNVHNSEVFNLYTLLDLFPRQWHRHRRLRFRTRGEHRRQALPARVLHPINVNLRALALGNRPLNRRDLRRTPRALGRKQSRKFSHLVVLIRRLEWNVNMDAGRSG